MVMYPRLNEQRIIFILIKIYLYDLYKVSFIFFWTGVITFMYNATLGDLWYLPLFYVLKINSNIISGLIEFLPISLRLSQKPDSVVGCHLAFTKNMKQCTLNLLTFFSRSIFLRWDLRQHWPESRPTYYHKTLLLSSMCFKNLNSAGIDLFDASGAFYISSFRFFFNIF